MNEVQRPAPNMQKQQAMAQAQQHAQNMKSRFKSRKSPLKFLVVLVVIVLLLVGGWFLKMKVFTGGINKDRYQAVLLTNGQAYFGKLHNTHGAYLKMTELFTVQVQAKTGDDAAKTEQNATQSQDGQPTLVKHGTELAGGEDEIFFSRDQVVFWENLKGDSKVSTAIQEYKNK